MDDTKRQALAGLLIGLVPPDGSAIGNQSLREGFIEAAKAAGHKNTGSALEVAFESLREELLQKGVLAKGTVSLPFEAGDNKKVAVKIVDDRGIESVKVIQLDVTIGDGNRRPGGPTP